MPSTSAAHPHPRVLVDDSACDVDDLSPCGAVLVTSEGDEAWDGLVDLAVESGWPGVEALSGIDGSVASVVRRNAAAFGQEVADVVASVRTWDRQSDAQRTFAWADCRFVASGSRLQEQLPDGRERYEIRQVTFQFRQGDLTAPLRDEQLAAAVGVEPGQRVPLAAVREAVLRA